MYHNTNEGPSQSILYTKIAAKTHHSLYIHISPQKLYRFQTPFPLYALAMTRSCVCPPLHFSPAGMG